VAKRIVVRTFLLLALMSSGAFAQRPPDRPVSAEERTRIILAAADRIERYYVDVAAGKEIADSLRESVRSARVTAATTALALVPVVNEMLRVKGDKHLRFGYSHEPERRPEDAPETPEERSTRANAAREDGFGIHGVERLEGNVGLLTWARFHHPDVAGDAVAAAMHLLQSSDALIIDLRGSDGGAPAMVNLLLTYFLSQGDPLLISSVENRFRGITQQLWSLPYLPGPRYTGRDVYILTSKRTWSAAEGFAEHMRRLRGATIIGEVTRGGARMSRWMTIHPHFAVSVSVARHLPPTRDWEGVGIKPDIEIAEAEALETAHRMALGKLRENAGVAISPAIP
jgi:C-terminal processing protease CtpA/Prc